MFFPGIPNIFVPGDSVFMLFKCMCNNISIVKKEKKKKTTSHKRRQVSVCLTTKTDEWKLNLFIVFKGIKKNLSILRKIFR